MGLAGGPDPVQQHRRTVALQEGGEEGGQGGEVDLLLGGVGPEGVVEAEGPVGRVSSPAGSSPGQPAGAAQRNIVCKLCRY